MSKEIKYLNFVPGGNDTAFVFGLEFTNEEKKIINDKIMRDSPNVEQVGFLGDRDNPELVMAGGEFCGNATRSAAFYYLDGKDGEITLKVNSKDYIKAGVKDKKAWCEIPLKKSGKIVEKINDNIYKVNMEGMTTLVVLENEASKYLVDKDNLKSQAKELMAEYELLDSEAVGVMFLENINGTLKINPIVWVNSIDTLFYETACGSGTTATAIVKSFINKKGLTLDVLQPSSHVITASISLDENGISNAVISGNVFVENDTKTILL